MKREIIDSIFNIKNQEEFDDLAIRIFRYQAANNIVYREYIKNLNVNPENIEKPGEIPFMPVEFFRSHKIITGPGDAEVIFESSGTTGNKTSRHYVTDTGIYRESFLRTFRLFYGEPEDYVFFALLPSYMERENSSLVYMVGHIMRSGRDKRSRFFLHDNENLVGALKVVKEEGSRAILLGVSYALLDLAGEYSPDLSGIIVIETGGMKGRRKEMTREELHSELKAGFKIDSVHSEYGMTELLSQAWSAGDGIFNTPPWMRVFIRDSYDPLTVTRDNDITGGINIIDLANINSCSFIATGDIGKLNKNGSFEVLGRFDNSDIRGCNLLFE